MQHRVEAAGLLSHHIESFAAVSIYRITSDLSPLFQYLSKWLSFKPEYSMKHTRQQKTMKKKKPSGPIENVRTAENIDRVREALTRSPLI